MAAGIRWLWLAAALAAAGIALHLGYAEPAQSRSEPPRLPRLWGDWSATGQRLNPGVDAVEPVTSAPPADTNALQAGEEEVELCGGDWLRAPAAGHGALTASLTTSAPLTAARARLVQALQADQRAPARAAAFWLQTLAPGARAVADGTAVGTASPPSPPDGASSASEAPSSASAPHPGLAATLVDTTGAARGSAALPPPALETLVAGAGSAPVTSLGSSAPRAPTPTTCIPGPCATPEAGRASTALEQLAQVAATTQDPQVYALAFEACRAAGSPPGSCALLTAEQWARLDSGNARPWFHVLDHALSRRDRATGDEALHRIATSTQVQARRFHVAALIAATAGADDRSRVAALSLALDAIAAHPAQPAPRQTLRAACEPALLANANRWQTCSAVAELLVGRADSSADRALGIDLGQAMGWPADRLGRLREAVRRDAAAAIWTDPGEAGLGLADCSRVRRQLAAIERRARLGTVGGTPQDPVSGAPPAPPTLPGAPGSGAVRGAAAEGMLPPALRRTAAITVAGTR